MDFGDLGNDFRIDSKRVRLEQKIAKRMNSDLELIRLPAFIEVPQTSESPLRTRECGTERLKACT